MKTSLALAIAILILGAVPGIYPWRQLSEIRESRLKLTVEAARLGLSADTPDNASESRVANRQRQEMAKQADATAAEIISLARKMEELRKSGGKPDGASQKQAMDLMGNLTDADASGLQQVLAQLKDYREISSATRGELAAYSIIILAEDHPEAAAALFAESPNDPGRRDAVLAALRGYLATLPDESERNEIRGRAFGVFASAADTAGYDNLTKWLADSKLTPEEKTQFANGLTYFTSRENTGRWVEWMSGNLAAESLPDPVREIVGEWTRQDYAAAGKWLATTPDGPAKQAAVAAYAEAVAEYEPQVAVQWALTLPAGTQRDATFKSIYQNWPASDPEGAAGFARAHGLE
jgi:hypothetical protein